MRKSNSRNWNLAAIVAVCCIGFGSLPSEARHPSWHADGHRAATTTNNSQAQGSLVANPKPGDGSGGDTQPPNGTPDKPKPDQKPRPRPKPDPKPRPKPRPKPPPVKPTQPEGGPEIGDAKPESEDTRPSEPVSGDEASTSAGPRLPTQENEIPAFNPGSRLRAMQSRLLDAARPTFSSPGRAAGDEEQPEMSVDFEPGQVLVAVDTLEEARAFQNKVAGDGFRVASRRIYRALGMVVLRLRTPEGMQTMSAVTALRDANPNTRIALNHRYRTLALPEKKSFGPRLVGWSEPASLCQPANALGMIDSPVSLDHPVFEGVDIEFHSVTVAGAPEAPSDHGTAVAGILTSRDSAGFHVGVANTNKLIVVNAFRGTDEGEAISNVGSIVSALDILLSKSVPVINMSLGGAANLILESAVEKTIDSGTLIVAAAGNTDGDEGFYPAAYPRVIAVAAVDSRQKPMLSGGSGRSPDFAAPGVDVWSPVAGGGGRYMTGSSFAAPYVSALVLQHKIQNPEATYEEIYALLRQSADDLGPPGRDPQTGWGVISWRDAC